MRYKSARLAEQIDKLERKRAAMVERHESVAAIQEITRELANLRRIEDEVLLYEDRRREEWT